MVNGSLVNVVLETACCIAVVFLRERSVGFGLISRRGRIGAATVE